MRKKIIGIFSLIFFISIILNINNVFGVGILSQSWVDDKNGNGKPDLLYRTYTKAHDSTVTNYHKTVSNDLVEGGKWTYTYNGKKYTSKWIYDSDTGVPTPGHGQYSTITFAYHSKPMGIYTKSGDIGYNMPDDGEVLGYGIDTIASAFKNSTQKMVTPTKSSVNTYDKVVFYELHATKGTYKTVNWGTGLTISNLYSTGKRTGYRYAIVDFGNANVYIADEIVYDTDKEALIQAAKAAGRTESCYVSNVLISKAYSSGSTTYEVSKTLYDFYQQHEKNWNASVDGISDNAMGAVANLYDNELIFPQTAKRNVYVRHINIGNNKTISTNIIRNGQRMKSNNLWLLTLDGKNKVQGVAYTTSYPYDEYYEGKLESTDSFKKNALVDTSDYECIGYNVSVANSLSTAQNAINTRISKGLFNSGKTVSVLGNDNATSDEYIVIDFYYAETREDVYVNHLYVDQNGYVKAISAQTIKPNSTAKLGTTTINRTNNDTYTSEVYNIPRSGTLTTRIADSLKEELTNNSALEYKGYETFTAKTASSSLVGKQRTNLKTAQTVNLNNKTVQVNYYYYLDNQVEQAEPKKEIEGKVFVTPLEISTSCNDDGRSLPSVTSLPSGSKAKVGIQNIPRYMVGAITTKYVSPADEEHEIDITVNITMGTETKTVKYENLPYRAGYYKITDMAVYKLKNVTIFDAGNGYDGTEGESMFSWAKGNLVTKPKDKALTVELQGINGKISNTSKAINDINNYVAVNIETKNGIKSENGTSTSKLDISYLDEEQLNSVDANKDGIVNATDKTFADSERNRYYGILTEKKSIQAEKQKAYDNAVTTAKNLENAYQTASKELERLKGIYDEKLLTLAKKYLTKNTAESNLKTLEETTLPTKQAELEELQEQERTALGQQQTAEDNLETATSRKEELNTEYQNSIALRNELAAKANCTDSVEDEVYISLEQDEKDALEQCKQYKLEYAQNLENRVVEKAQEAYESYSANEWEQANKALEDATDAHDTVVSDIANKEDEISTVKSDIFVQEALVEMLQRDYSTYYTEEFIPARDNYTNYRDNQYAKAKAQYDAYVTGNYVQKALDALNSAKSETDEAQSAYDEYSTYRTNLYNNYNKYKALYDEFKSISGTNKEIAEQLGLKINIYVQNMIVKVNGELLANASSNTSKYTSALSTYMSAKEVPQVKTEIPVISKEVYSSIGSTEIAQSDYTNSNNIDEDVLNGVRVLTGKADYEAQVVIGSGSVNNITDTVYYSDQSNINKTVVFKLKTTKLSKTYTTDKTASNSQAKYEEVGVANVYTPITVTATLESNSNQIVDQTNTAIDASMVQINTPFTITFGNNAKPAKYNISNTDKYNGGYYIKFDFDVHEVSINGKKYNRGNRIPANTWIGVISENKNGEAYITAQAYGNVEDDNIDVISEENGTYVVRAVAYNATTLMLNNSNKYARLEDMKNDNSDLKDMVNNICDELSYFAEKEYGVLIVNRAYDFKITDIKDISWKSVFRKTSSAATNAHTGNVYYSGTTKWNTKSERSNNIISRTSSEIGRNPLRILPLGPYKSTDTTYIDAPKLGYRFSFDLKVTGSYFNSEGEARTDKKVNIQTKFYYISKNGKTYYEESDGTKEGIYLFYKTSAGKYVRIGQAGGDYSLRFTPNDGYRYIEDDTTTTLSTKSVKLGNLRNITLTYEMATPTDNRSAITYYGEYKLPNSTIAVKVNSDGSYDINSPLTDGYIGVIFDIVAYSGTVNVGGSSQTVQLSYDKDTKENTPNTSQWDYEGFLGFTNYGSRVKTGEVSLKLEKGTWQISNDIYNKIKGTVILYDIDERAASDYD